jgi:hypothetical protein
MYLRNVILVALAIATVSFAQSLASPAPASVDVPYQVRYAVNLTSEAGGPAGSLAGSLDAYFNIANDGAQGASPYGSGIIGQQYVGNICVNVYAFDNAEELVSCCSCLITPDETVGLSLEKDILNNPANGLAMGSLTIKLLATAPPGNGSSCAQSAILSSPVTLVTGMLAWGTTGHLFNQGETFPLVAGSYFGSETPFSPATLSSGEQTSLANKCSAFVGNGTGYGVCNSCEKNALGGQKM